MGLARSNQQFDTISSPPSIHGESSGESLSPPQFFSRANGGSDAARLPNQPTKRDWAEPAVPNPTTPVWLSLRVPVANRATFTFSSSRPRVEQNAPTRIKNRAGAWRKRKRTLQILSIADWGLQRALRTALPKDLKSDVAGDPTARRRLGHHSERAKYTTKIATRRGEQVLIRAIRWTRAKLEPALGFARVTAC